MRRPSFGFVGFLVALGLTGCGVNFYSGRPTDVRKIHELSSEMERLQHQKEAENNQLRDAMEALQRQLQREIGDNEAKLAMTERGLVITFVAEVLFDSGKAEVKPQARETLGKVASVIQQKVADREIGIEGHTDNDPIKHSGWKSNWELSTGRATSVLHVMEDEGVNPGQMVASGYGEYRPVASNDDSQGRSKNRRVEIVIIPKKLTQRELDLIRQGETSGSPELREKARALEQYK